MRRAALILASAAGLAGCGGHTATKQDVVARANAICAGSVRQVRATPPPAGGQTSLPELSAYLQRILPIVNAEVSALRSLPRPNAQLALLNRYIAAVTSSGSDYKALAAAARRGDRGGVAQALSALRANPSAGLAGRYGLSQCAGVSATVG